MKTRSTFRTASLLLLLLSIAFAAAAAEPRSQYLVVLKPVKNGHRKLPDAEIAQMGGQVDFTRPDRIVVTIPDTAAEALKKHDAVKYIQKLIVGKSVAANQAPPSIMRISTQSSALHPAPTGTLEWKSGTYKYDGVGNIYTIGLAGESGVTAHTYTYDELSRLKRAVASGTLGETETWNYDPYGNITQHVRDNTTTNVDVVSATNRLRVGAGSPYTYDPMGDLASDAASAYAYDPLLQMREKDYGIVDSEMYVYTADDERIGVKTDDTWTWSLRDFGGKVIRQYQSSQSMPIMGWLWVEDYVYRDGMLIAAERVPEEGGRRHFHLDHLGSPRLVTGDQGLEVAHHEFAPFGVELFPLWQETTNGFDREDPMRFTGHERDFAMWDPVTRPYLDYMHARYYDPNPGRFLSVDPSLGTPNKPQSWNRYAYVRNNPIRFTDTDGREIYVWGVPDGAVWNYFWHDFYNRASGFANALASDMLLGQGRVDLNNTAYREAQVLGDAAAVAVGLVEIGEAFAGEVGGTLLDLSVVGLPEGLALQAASTAVGLHGATTALMGGVHLMSSVNQMNHQVKAGQAPADVKRVERAKEGGPGGKDHVHFKDGSALNRDGTWRHGYSKLTNAVKQWLASNGWQLPK
jgi:RHS repeat-associated protein